jgi:hypothetical protein
MSSYLAAILVLVALTTPSFAAVVLPAQHLQLSQETPLPVAAPSSSPQDPPQNSAPANPTAEPAQTGAEPQSGAQPETKKPESAAPPAKAKTTSKKRRHRKTGAGTSSATPDKKVVRNGGTTDPVVQLTPGMSKEQASSQRQNTAQLLAATDNNLRQISARPLNSSQQDSVSQIRKYMEQAKVAEQAGDLERSHNLASKALLLSDDLVKH